MFKSTLESHPNVQQHTRIDNLFFQYMGPLLMRVTPTFL